MITSAQSPSFLTPLTGGVYGIGDPIPALDSAAQVSDGGTLSYQWQKSADGETWEDIAGADGLEYLPPTDEGGVTHYRCAAENRVGIDSAASISEAAIITVYVAEVPAFAAELQDAAYDCGDVTAALNGTAAASYGTVTYQWYEDGQAIPGATEALFSPPSAEAGVHQYYVVATNVVGDMRESAQSGTATITIYGAKAPVFVGALSSAEYECGDTAAALDGTAKVERGTVSYQWYQNGMAIPGATSAAYVPPTTEAGRFLYSVTAVNTVGTSTASAVLEGAVIVVYGAEAPIFTVHPESAEYLENDPADALYAAAEAARGTVAIRWQRRTSAGEWEDIPGATGGTYTPPTEAEGTFFYRAAAVNQVGTSAAEGYSSTAVLYIRAAQVPVFSAQLRSSAYRYAAAALRMDGSAGVADGGTITYQWYRALPNSEEFTAIPGATDAVYTPSTVIVGVTRFYVAATNTLRGSSRSAQSNTAEITVIETRLSPSEKWALYLEMLRQGNFQKLCRLDFLQPDGSVAFSLDNNQRNPRSRAFIQEGTLEVNLQNGQRRRATVTLSNLDRAYDFAVGKIWFGQQIRLMEGILLSNGDEFYLPQGVFYVSDPEETFQPGQRTVTYQLLDKWAYLDGTLFGNLEGIYEVPLGTNILMTISSLLKLDRGNGYPVDNVPPIFSDYWNGKTVTLQDGTVESVLSSPYTYRCDSGGGTYADVMLEMNTMLVGWIGYDQTGHLRLDAGDDDILDTTKPVLWTFSPTERQFLGATYSTKMTKVYNDIIVEGQALDDGSIPFGRATNMDPRSDTSIYSSLGRRTLRKSAPSYYADSQCREFAAYTLKRNTVLQKSVSIRTAQIFHIRENCLVEIRRPDKEGAPTERHLVTGFSRPLAGTEEMVVNCTSVLDFVDATQTERPGS